VPRVTSVKQYNSFVKGLVTEASALTFPENASLDEDNFVLKRNGSRERRLGIDYEVGYSLVSTGFAQTILDSGKQSYHKWENPGGDTSVSIGVIRVYNKLWFVDLLKSAPSANLLNGGLPLTIPGLLNGELDTAVINNYLVIVSKDLAKPVSLIYDTTTQLVEQVEIPIQIRDLFGLVDEIPVSERPITLTNLHKYNLINQGWKSDIQDVCTATIKKKAAQIAKVLKLATGALRKAVWEGIPIQDGGTPGVITCTFTRLGYYPSNADIWTLGKGADAGTPTTFERYDPEAMIKNSIDNMEAPKGTFILDAFERGVSRRTLIGDATLPLDSDAGKISTIASYASRVFYSGIESLVTGGDGKSPNLSNYVFFSQVVTAPEKLGLCYQDADPTSPNISDIIDTDGGAIQIPEVTRITKLMSLGTSLLVFAENGVWEVFGDTNGFVATSYQVNKVSSNGCSSPKSIVSSGNSVFAWTKAGIYLYTQDPVTGRYIGENISLLTVQSLYTGLSELSKNNARGLYDEKENTVRWLYNDESTYPGTLSVNRYNRELVLDLTLQAFYPQSVQATTPYVADYVDVPNYTVADVDESVYAGAEAVLVGAEQVVVTAKSLTSRITPFSFLTIVGTAFTLSKYNNRGFKDWFVYNGLGVSFRSFLLTGYEIFEDIMRTKQVPYIWFYFQRTEDGYSDVSGSLILDNPSGCQVSSQWNWTNSAASGKWGSAFKAYRFKRMYTPTGAADTFDYGYDVIVTKNKLRGSGRSLSLLIESEEGKDMRLLGWALIVSGGSNP